METQGGVTIGKRFKDSDKENYPAPNQYHVKQPKSGGITIGKKFPKKRDTDKQNEVFYEVQGSYNKTQIKNTKAVIGKSKRPKFANDDNPGPNHYSIKDTSNPKPQTIGKSKRQTKKEDTNNRFYEAGKSKDAISAHVPAATIPKSKNPSDPENPHLGPGSYSEKPISGGPAYTIMEKHPVKPSTDDSKYYNTVEGYNATVAKAQVAFLDTAVGQKEPITDTPGVGSYTLPQHRSQGKTIGIKLKPADEQERAPGPGVYKPSWDEASTNYIYDIKFVTQKRIPDEKTADYPGPCQYKPELPWNRGPVIGTGVRDGEKSGETPGPCQYKPTLPWDKGPVMGTEARKDPGSGSTPGPSDYFVPTMVPIIQSVNKPSQF